MKCSGFRFESFVLPRMVNPEGMLEDDEIGSSYHRDSHLGSEELVNLLVVQNHAMDVELCLTKQSL